MKKLFFLGLLFTFNLGAFAQKNVKTSQDIYILDENGKRISQAFSHLDEFNNMGVAVCAVGGTKENRWGDVKNGKYGLVKEDGTFLLNPSYSLIDDFEEKSKRYIFVSNEKYGLLNENGQVVVSPIYSKIESNYVSPNIFIAQWNDSKAVLINQDGKVLSKTYQKIDQQSDFFETTLAGQKGYLDKTGSEVLPNAYSSIRTLDNNTFLVEDLQDKKSIVDLKNNALTSTKYDEITVIYENGNYYGDPKMFIVSLNGKYGILDKNYKVLVPVSKGKIEELQVNNKSIFSFEANKKFGLLDNNGKEIVKPIYNEIRIGLEKLIIVSKGGKPDEYGYLTGEKWGVIDLTGKEILKVMYDEVDSYGYEIVSFKSKENWYGFDENLNMVLSEGYSKIDEISDKTIIVNKGGSSDGYYVSGGVFGVCDSKGKIIVPIQYEEIKSEGYNENQILIVKKNGKYGFMTPEGKTLIEPKYYSVDCENEACIVSLFREKSEEVKYGLLSRDLSQEKLLTEIKYDAIQKLSGNVNNYAVNLKKAWGVISEDGKEIIPITHYFIDESGDYNVTDHFIVNKNGTIDKSSYYNSYSVEGGSFGLINNKNQEVLALEYSKIDFLNDSLVLTVGEGIDGKSGIYNLKRKKYIIPKDYEYIRRLGYYDESSFLVANNVKLSEYGSLESGDMGVIDLNNKIIIPLNYSEIEYDNSMYICNSLDFTGYSLFNKDGKEMLKGYELLVSLDDSLVFWKNKSEANIFNINSGTNMLKQKYLNGFAPDYISSYNNYSIAVKNTNNKWGFVNKLGQEFISCQYDDAKPSDDPYLIVAKYGENNEFLYGVVNLKNEVLIPFEYQSIEAEYDKKFTCIKGKTAFKINSANEILDKKPYTE